MKKSLFALPFLVVAAVGFAQIQVNGPDFTDLKGKVVKFNMTDTNGKIVTNQTLKGKVVLLDFWATWCGPCKAASPTIQMLHEKYAKAGLVAIGANSFEHEDPAGAAAKYANEHQYTYKMTVKNDEFAKSLGINGIPSFLVIGRDGVVVLAQVGFSKGKTEQVLEDAVKMALAKK